MSDENTRGMAPEGERSYAKDAWLSGPADIVTDDVFVPELNGGEGAWVKVRALTAGQKGSISEQCTHVKGQKVTVDSTRIRVLTFQMGCVEPSFTVDEANVVAHKFGESFELVVGVIDAISGAAEEDIERAKNRFRPRR